MYVEIVGLDFSLTTKCNTTKVKYIIANWFYVAHWCKT